MGEEACGRFIPMFLSMESEASQDFSLCQVAGIAARVAVPGIRMEVRRSRERGQDPKYDAQLRRPQHQHVFARELQYCQLGPHSFQLHLRLLTGEFVGMQSYYLGLRLRREHAIGCYETKKRDLDCNAITNKIFPAPTFGLENRVCFIALIRIHRART